MRKGLRGPPRPNSGEPDEDKTKRGVLSYFPLAPQNCP